jgi:hypothetical protein
MGIVQKTSRPAAISRKKIFYRRGFRCGTLSTSVTDRYLQDATLEESISWLEGWLAGQEKAQSLVELERKSQTSL